MSEFWHAAALWTAQSLLAGGAALFVAWLMARRITDPARRLRAMQWSVRTAVLACVLALLPAWWKLPIPTWKEYQQAQAEERRLLEFMESEPIIRPSDDMAMVPVEIAEVTMPEARGAIMELAPPEEAEVEVEQLAQIPLLEPDTPQPDMLAEIAPIILVPYWVCLGVVLLQQAVGHIGLWRLRRSATPANERVRLLSEDLADGSPLPRILVSERVASPVCFGVLKPTILLPKTLAKSATLDQLRWVLAHELDHLRRGDPGTGVWIGFARAIYFVLPWFWSVRRELDLTQEYLADAAAAGSRSADYAAFLVELSSRPGVSRVVKAVPTLAGVRAGQSDLYRRVTMLLEPKSSRKSRWGRAWTTLAIGGTVAVAVALSGVRLTADEPKKTDKKSEEVQVEVHVRDKKDGDKKPVERKDEVEVIIVTDGAGNQTAEIEKAIEEAAKKGDVEAVKKLVAKLKAATAPQIARVKHPVPPVPPVPPAVAFAEKIPAEALVKMKAAREAAHADLKKHEEAIAKLKKAAEEVKDQPEAKAAIEKTIAEYHKKIADAHEKGHLKMAEEAQGQARIFRIDAGQAAAMEKVKAQMAEMMKTYEKQLEKLKGNEKATEAVKEAMKKYKESMETLMKQLPTAGAQGGLFKMPEGQLQWQGVKFPEADNIKPMVWTAKVAASDKARLGVTIEAVPAIIVEQLDLPKGQGVILSKVIEGTPAAKAGLKTNDIVLEIAGKIATVEDLPKVVSGLKDDTTFDVVIVRKGKKETIKGVTIPSPPKDSSSKDKVKDGTKKSSQSSMSVSVNNDQFEIAAKQDGVAYMLTGTVGDEAGTTIVIAEGDKKSTYKGVKSVPAEHREKVAKILKSVGGNK